MLTESDLVSSPAWFPLDRAGTDGSLSMVRLSQAAYAAASFLDQRLLSSASEIKYCPPEVVAAAAAALPLRLHYIFHTGHVGSTLVSRLMGASQSFFVLREPVILRQFAQVRASEAGSQVLAESPNLKVLLALLSRTWRPQQHAVIKATSFVSEIAEVVLAAPERSRAIFIFASPLAYLRGIFGGPNSRVETKILAPSRLLRLARYVPGPLLTVASEGEWVAMSWLCEMMTLHRAAARFPAQVLWLDFDALLREPAPALRRIFQMMGAPASVAEIEAIVKSPIMGRYSKGPEHAYDAALRHEVLMSADWQHRPEIKRGMDWLATAGVRHPQIAALLNAFE